MKLNTTALIPFFCILTLATITLEDIPSEVRAGSDYHIKWTQDHDYNIQAFYLLHKPYIYPNFGVEQHVPQPTNYTAGSHGLQWKVPAVKNNGVYKLWLDGVEPDNLDYMYGGGFDAMSVPFRIVGGPLLYTRENVGVVVGLVVLVGAGVEVWWWWRRMLVVAAEKIVL
ncbi:hypothetical protein Q7P35_002422 [Cladosporium inversicolor]